MDYVLVLQVTGTVWADNDIPHRVFQGSGPGSVGSEDGPGALAKVLRGECAGLPYYYKDQCNMMWYGNIVVPTMKALS